MPLISPITWNAAIRHVLEVAGEPLHYVEITSRILDNGLRQTEGATPERTVSREINQSINRGDGVFVRVSSGVFDLVERAPRAVDEPAGQPTAVEVDEQAAGAIRAFGMFWERNLVTWQAAPLLRGVQVRGAVPVTFDRQIGVYVLHDRERIIYAGQAAQESMSARLRQHTRDRLAGRWNRFSWFGLYGVRDDGSLENREPVFDKDSVIDALEAVLIECIEPPQNRRRGNSFSGIEYLQFDPSAGDARRY